MCLLQYLHAVSYLLFEYSCFHLLSFGSSFFDIFYYTHKQGPVRHAMPKRRAGKWPVPVCRRYAGGKPVGAGFKTAQTGHFLAGYRHTGGLPPALTGMPPALTSMPLALTGFDRL